VFILYAPFTRPQIRIKLVSVVLRSLSLDIVLRMAIQVSVLICMVVLSLAFRDAVTIGVSLLLLLLWNAKDTVDAVSTRTLGVVVAPRVVLLRLYRRRWCVGDDGHRASLLLLLLLLRSASSGLLLLLLVMNMLRLFRRLIPDDPVYGGHAGNVVLRADAFC
jgi:hypothetical protein